MPRREANRETPAFARLAGCDAGARPAGAHEVRPGYLDLTETSANLFEMTWKVPALGAFHLAIEPRFPNFCHIVGAPIAIETGGAFLEHGELRCERGLGGGIIEIEGLEATVTNVLVRVAFAEGTVQTAPLSRATSPSPSPGLFRSAGLIFSSASSIS
jgi:hypothetical protein